MLSLPGDEHLPALHSLCDWFDALYPADGRTPGGSIRTQVCVNPTPGVC
jgi:hypothetical protein